MPPIPLAALLAATPPEGKVPVIEPAETHLVPWFAAVVERSQLKGYAEIRGSYTDADGTPWTLLERLRPTLKVDLAERVTAQIAVEAAVEQGRYAPAEAVALLEEEIGEQLFQSLLDANGCTLDVERSYDSVGDVLSLERLFLDINLPKVDLRAGRQGVNWGSALVFNPTDVFAEVIVAEPWRERQGVDALRATVPFGESAQIVGIVGAEEDADGGWTGARGGLRATKSWSKLDTSLVAYTDGDRSFGGLDLKGDLGVGWWLEGGYDGDLRASLGVDYSFSVLRTLYLAAQLSYDGSGSAPEDYDLTSRASGGLDGLSCTDAPEGSPLASPTTEGQSTSTTLGRWYAVGVLNWTLNDDLSVAGTTLWNLEDGTGMVFPSVGYKLGGRFALNAGVQFLLGEDGEFRPDPADLTLNGIDLSGLLPTWNASAWVRYSL